MSALPFGAAGVLATAPAAGEPSASLSPTPRVSARNLPPLASPSASHTPKAAGSSRSKASANDNGSGSERDRDRAAEMESPVVPSPTADRDSAAADQSPQLASPSMSVEMQAMQQAPRPASGNNRVHPAQAQAASSGSNGGDSLAVPVTGGAHVRGRSSVFFGRPDEAMIAAAEAAADSDEEEEEDEAVARSAFHRQRSIVTTAAGSGHRVELLVATFNLLVHLGTILTDLMLLSDYSQNGQNVSAGALAIIRVLVGLVEIQFDYLNRGWKNRRWIFIPLIFCNGRILLEYHAYLRAWARHRRLPWASSDFRAAVSFETFIGSLPSLIVQTYVVISDPRPVQQVWVVALAMTAVSASVDLLHHYKYVSVESSIYLAQFLKAVVSTGMRTVLVAVLLDVIGRVTLAWAIVSFLFGCAVYYAAVRWARSRERDDPFQYGSLVAHYAFGGLIAATQLFVSIPFAPSHSIYDWSKQTAHTRTCARMSTGQ